MSATKKLGSSNIWKNADKRPGGDVEGKSDIHYSAYISAMKSCSG